MSQKEVAGWRTVQTVGKIAYRRLCRGRCPHRPDCEIAILHLRVDVGIDPYMLYAESASPARRQGTSDRGQISATASTSTRTPFGSALTATQLLAGFSVKYFA